MVSWRSRAFGPACGVGRRSFSASALVGCGCRAGCSRRCVCLFGGHGRLVRGFACLIDDGVGAVLRGLGWRGGVVGFVGGIGLVDWAAALFFASRTHLLYSIELSFHARVRS